MLNKKISDETILQIYNSVVNEDMSIRKAATWYGVSSSFVESIINVKINRAKKLGLYPYKNINLDKIDKILIENGENMTIREIEEILPSLSAKSINRRLEKLRAQGLVGYKDEETKKRAYKQRSNKS